MVSKTDEVRLIGGDDHSTPSLKGNGQHQSIDSRSAPSLWRVLAMDQKRARQPGQRLIYFHGSTKLEHPMDLSVPRPGPEGLRDDHGRDEHCRPLLTGGFENLRGVSTPDCKAEDTP